MAITWRPVDGHAVVLKFLTQCIDIVNAVGQMTEVTSTGIFLRIPVIGAKVPLLSATILPRCHQEI